MRRFVALMILSLAAAGVAHAQVGYDRRGGDYTNFSVRSGDPALCAARCERDGRCQAWSFVYPSAERRIAQCWLKNRVPPRTEAPCCASGVRGAGVIEPRSGGVEYSLDRIGGDYRNFEVPADPAGASCKAACEADSKCRAWTYQRPGYFGPGARCFLKSQIKPPRRRPYAISGVVR